MENLRASVCNRQSSKNMIRKSSLVLFCVLFFVAAGSFAEQPAGKMAFTVSMGEPNEHLFHVVFRCEDLKGQTQDFKMPAWTPGYYGIFNFAKNVQNFQAADADGKPLKWEKTKDNTWQVQSNNASVITASYDVRAATQFVAQSYLDKSRAYIVPTSVFLHVAGLVRHPVTVEIMPYPKWNRIATGLESVQGKPNTYQAEDFDVLYDSPLLVGNLEELPSFEINGIPHYFLGYKVGNFDHKLFMENLKAAVEAGTKIIGDIPYKHYTFIAIGPGQGGLEHLNSTSFSFDGGEMDNKGMDRDLAFLSHEYFHNYNVKRIRPIALGPFDYDKANLTNMLWVSEGFTVYYEYLMLARAGLMTQEKVLDGMRKCIAAYENNTGHLFQSATQSSYDSWTQGPFGGGSGKGVRKTISYYDKGAALGMLLDFKIRHVTQNKKSLDDVMRTLYREFYKDKQRGFTDQEFQDVCERIAGCPLQEIFEYASTVKDVDYPKYLGYAGLALEEPNELQDAYVGAVAEDVNGLLVVAAVEGNSPASRADLKAQDQIKAVDGEHADSKGLDGKISAKKPGGKVKLAILRAGKDLEVDATLAHKMKRSFRIKPIPNPDQLQSEILNSWLKPQ